MTPQARRDQLLVQEVADELVIYDQERHQAHSLNRTAALVWRYCDGKTTIAALTSLVARELNLPADEDVVWLALDRLDKAKLLQERLIRPSDSIRISRRQLVRKLGLAAGLTLLLPVVTSSKVQAESAGNPSPTNSPGNSGNPTGGGTLMNKCGYLVLTVENCTQEVSLKRGDVICLDCAANKSCPDKMTITAYKVGVSRCDLTLKLLTPCGDCMPFPP